MTPSKPVTAIVIGAGGRGMTYSSFSKLFPDRFRVVGAAEPKEYNRQWMANNHAIPAENIATDWHDLAERPRLADAAIISTQDAMHAEPAIAFARLGYAMLLEKPMAPNEADCRRIVQAVKADRHPLRRLPRAALHQLHPGAEGAARLGGDRRGGQHPAPRTGGVLAPGAFLRARQLAQRGGILVDAAGQILPRPGLAALHDGRQRCLSVSSFGSLKHFKQSEKPAAAGRGDALPGLRLRAAVPLLGQEDLPGPAGERRNRLAGRRAHPRANRRERHRARLRTGPTGAASTSATTTWSITRWSTCSSKAGKTAAFTMTAFNQAAHRKTRIFGTPRRDLRRRRNHPALRFPHRPDPGHLHRGSGRLPPRRLPGRARRRRLRPDGPLS